MLTILTAVQLSWFVLFCCALFSVQGAAERSRDSTDLTEVFANKALPLNCKSCASDQSSNSRLQMATSGGRAGQEVEREPPNADLVSQFQQRQRKKQWRIMETLMHLNGIMGSRNRSSGAGESNIGGGRDGAGDEGGGSLQSSTEEEEETIGGDSLGKKLKDPDISRIIMLLPMCPSQTSAKNKAFRLFFSIIPPDRTIRTPVINVKTAVLHLKRKTLKSDLINGNSDASQNWKSKGKRANAANEHVIKWRARIQVYNMPKGETKSVVKYFDLDPRNSTQWVKVNVRRVVEEWLKTSRRNLGLQLTIVNGRNQTIHPGDVFHNFNCDQSKNTPTGDGMEEDEDVDLVRGGHQPSVTTDPSSSSSVTASIPYLEVVLARAPSEATKRIVRHLPKKKNLCEAIPITVKIEDLKGKWKKNIIRPKRFRSNVCRGTCHRCSSRPAANRTLSLHENHSEGCCQPIKWRSPKAHILDDDAIVRYRNIPILAVAKCGCRR